MIPLPGALTDLVEPWAQHYGRSAVTPTLVTFVHLIALVVGGGLALSLDRATLSGAAGASPDPDLRRAHLGRLRDAHTFVVPALAAAILSGGAMLAADLEALWGSRILWAKLALLALLLANGGAMRHLESRLAAGADSAPAWGALRATAVISLMLWVTLVLAGVALGNAG